MREQMATNDADEILYLEAFLKAAGLQYEYDKQPAGAGPDFLLRSGESLVGLEITRVHRDPEPDQLPRRQMEGIRDSLMEFAKREWDRRGLPALEVHCHYNHRHTPFMAELHEVARELVEAVSLAIPSMGSVVHLGRDYQQPSNLPRAVHSLHIVRLAGHDRSYWFSSDAAWGAELTQTALQSRIDGKNAKFQSYRGTERETWLLVVMDSRRFSGMMHANADTTEHIYSSSFARTYLLDLLYRRIWPLQTRSPDSAAPA